MTRERDGAAARPAAPEYPEESVRNVPFRYAPGDGHVYLWHGGEYIERHRVSDVLAAASGAPSVAVDVINVWDYETGRPRIRRTAQAVAVAVDDWRYRQ